MSEVRRRPPAVDRDEQEPDEDDETIPQILKKKRKAEEEEKSKDNSKLVNGIIYTLFGFIVLTASLMPFSMKFMPKNKVVIELEKKGNAYEPFFSQKHKLFYYVDTATARKLAKLPYFLQHPITNQADRMIEEQLRLCMSDDPTIDFEQQSEKQKKKEEEEEKQKKKISKPRYADDVGTQRDTKVIEEKKQKEIDDLPKNKEINEFKRAEWKEQKKQACILLEGMRNTTILLKQIEVQNDMKFEEMFKQPNQRKSGRR